MPLPVDIYRWREAILSELGPGNPTARLVLMAVSMHMKADGTGAWPSQKLVAKRACVAERSVRQHLEIAERRGWIQRFRLRRPKGRAWYFTEYAACVPDSVYHQLPERPWEADPTWRRRQAARAGTSVQFPPSSPPTTGISEHSIRQVTTRQPAPEAGDNRQHVPINSSSELFHRTLPKEGALARTALLREKAKEDEEARRGKILTAIRQWPDWGDADIAKVTRTTLEEVRRERSAA